MQQNITVVFLKMRIATRSRRRPGNAHFISIRQVSPMRPCYTPLPPLLLVVLLPVLLH